MTTNNVLFVSDGDYGKRVGYLSAVVQGQYGQVIPLEIRDLANNVVNLTGYSTITGTLNDQRGNVTNIAGTLALDATPSTAPNANWTTAAADFGTPGVFMVMLSFSNGSATLKTIPVALTVHADPAVTAVAGTALVGVTTAQAALIAALAQLSGLANFNGTGGASAIKINLSATAAPGVGDDSGDGYSIGSIWLDTTNDNIYMATDVTVGAANWEQINGGGGASTWGSITGTLANQTDLQSALDAKATTAALSNHEADTTSIHGIPDTGALLDTSDLGVSVQAYSAKTAAIAALTWAANSIILLTGTATASVQALAAHVVTFLQSATAADARTAIGAGTGNGDVAGPSSSTDNQIVRFDGTTGKIIQGGAGSPTIDDTGITTFGAVVIVDGVALRFNSGATIQASVNVASSMLRLNAQSGIGLAFFADGAEVMRAATTGLIGIGTTSPQGKLHVYQTGGGFLQCYKSGVNGSATTVIPDAAGDVTLCLSGTFTVSDGAGNTAGGVITKTVPGGTFNLYDDGGTNTCQLQISAGGAVTVIRTAGSRTYAVNLALNWM